MSLTKNRNAVNKFLLDVFVIYQKKKLATHRQKCTNISKDFGFKYEKKSQI